MTNTEKPWGGVFTEKTDTEVERFTESIHYDWRLFRQDIRGSIAHARMLTDVGILTADEYQQIVDGLEEIRKDIETGAMPFRIDLEDIHMHVEHALIQRIGDVGRKLHTGRSRNDQVSTDLRLWVRDAIDTIDGLLERLQLSFLHRVELDDGVILPGYTHLQRAQPVFAAHYWFCYMEKFGRDRDRLADCRKRVNVCGLGAAAIAGTSLPIDRHRTAAYLDFEDVARNSMDVSGDRDFAIEFVFGLTQTALHLSNWAEEWILWSTSEFQFLRLPQTFCTGSSIMPQKVNPDVLELIRGKTARVVGDLQSLLVLVKGLPMAYNRDLQEDKERLFDAFDTVEAMLKVAAPLIAQATLNRAAIDEKIERGYLDATALMEYLIKRGVPQRTAHGIIGKLVRLAMDRSVPLAGLPLETFIEVTDGADMFDDTVFSVLGTKNAVAVMQSYGSTGAESIRQQREYWTGMLRAKTMNFP